jgi:hypothetical protein
VHSLYETLNLVKEVVQNAETLRRGSRGRQMAAPRDGWNVGSLREVIGDYQNTLMECEKLLADNTEFKRAKVSRNFVWSVRLGPTVKVLRQRLQCHSTKLQLLLVPLETSLLLDVWADLRARIDAVHEAVLPPRGIYVESIEEAQDQCDEDLTGFLDIPAPIELRFREASERSRPETSVDTVFPLESASDAFVLHLQESTKNFQGGIAVEARKPSAPQHVNLLKCCWIVRRIHGSENLRAVPENSIWPEFVQQMIQSVKSESARFRRGIPDRLIPPHVDLMLSLDDSYFQIWPGVVEAQPFPIRNTYQEAVLSLPLESTPLLRSPDITFYRIGDLGERSNFDATDYCLVEKGEDISAGGSRGEKSIKIDLNLTSIKVEPCYAFPSSKVQEYALLIHAGSSEVKPTLTAMKDVFQVQHLLTGYRPYANYFQHNMQASFVRYGDNLEWEWATVQLWLPERCEATATSPGTSTLPSPTSTASSSRSPPPRSARDRRSISSLSELGLHDDRREHHERTSPPSRQSGVLGSNRMSFASATSLSHIRRTASFSLRRKASSITSSQSVRTITATTQGVTKQVPYHRPPEKPMLVVALRSRAEILSLVAVEIDFETDMKRTWWDSDPQQQLKAHIVRGGTDLQVRRWTDEFNMAKLGIDQKYQAQNVANWAGVKRLSLKFNREEGKGASVLHLS